jgi:multiple sugar transport system permease protein
VKLQPAPAVRKRRGARLEEGGYFWFIAPAAIVVAAVIVFPWVFTLYMSVHAWKLGGTREFVGLANFARLLGDDRFGWSVLRTLWFTLLAVVAPVVLGLFAAIVFNRKFPLRGLARTVFILPMMATPVAIALVWTMMFHPQLGVLNYLLTSVGIPASQWVYHADSVIPTLVMVETWHWTPLVMLIVLGGLAALPSDPFEAARIDGANPWQVFRHVTWPLLLPYVAVAAIIRTIDALKTFDTIFVITQGGPGTASETINIFLYLQAFAYYELGYASAVVLVFFVLIVVLSLVMLRWRQRLAEATK